MKQLPFIAGQIAEEQCALIKHFADGGTIKRMPVKLRHVPGAEWEIMGLDDNFNFDYYEYRAVKEEAKPEMWDIADRISCVRSYAQKEEAKPEMCSIIVKAWFDGVGMFWRNKELGKGFVRVPKEDMLIEVPVQVFTTSIKGG